jgi:hypothetical protein
MDLDEEDPTHALLAAEAQIEEHLRATALHEEQKRVSWAHTHPRPSRGLLGCVGSS